MTYFWQHLLSYFHFRFVLNQLSRLGIQESSAFSCLNQRLLETPEEKNNWERLTLNIENLLSKMKIQNASYLVRRNPLVNHNYENYKKSSKVWKCHVCMTAAIKFCWKLALKVSKLSFAVRWDISQLQLRNVKIL